MKPTSICLPQIICGIMCLKILKKKKTLFLNEKYKNNMSYVCPFKTRHVSVNLEIWYGCNNTFVYSMVTLVSGLPDLNQT